MPTPTKPSVITQLLAARGILVNGVTITTEWAGEVLTPVGGKAETPTVQYLYGPSRDKAETAKLATLALPAALPAGKYTLKVQRLGEGDVTYHVINFAVAIPTRGSAVFKLFNDNDADGVLDAGELSTGRRPVEVRPVGGKAVGNNTDATGTYTFTGLADGKYQGRRPQFPDGYVCSNKDADAEGWIPFTIAGGNTVILNIGTKAVRSTDSNPNPTTPGDQGEVPSTTAMAICAAASVDPDLPVRSALWDGTKPAAQAYTAAGIKVCREWWSKDSDNGPWASIRKYIKAGFTGVSLCLNYKGDRLPTPEETSAWMKRVVASVPDDIKPYILFFSVGNEPAYGDYWLTVGANEGKGDENAIKTYVKLFLNPAYDVLHAAGYQVATAGLNGAFDKHYKILLDEGGKHDLIDLHPYCKSAGELDRKLDAIDAINVAGRKIVYSEWNVFLGHEYRDWLKDEKLGDTAEKRKAAADKKVLDEQNAQHKVATQRANPPQVACYFVSYVDGKWTSGLFGGLQLDANGKGAVTSPFYDKYLSAVKK